MKVRGTYEIQQTDRTMDEQKLRDIALVQILNHIGQQVMDAYGTSMRLESPSAKYPFGRYIVDLDITLLSGGGIDPGPAQAEGVSRIDG